MSSPERVDPRVLRLQQGVVAVVLLAGFVFRSDWVIPGTAAVLGIGVLAPRAHVLHSVWRVAIGPRLAAPTTTVSADEVRVSTLLVVATLGVATTLLAAGLGGLAWFVAVVLAVVEAVGAAAAIPIGRLLYDRLRRRR